FMPDSHDTLRCPTCNARFTWRAPFAGKKVRCKACHTVMRFPVSADEIFVVIKVGAAPQTHSVDASSIAPPPIADASINPSGHAPAADDPYELNLDDDPSASAPSQVSVTASPAPHASHTAV